MKNKARTSQQTINEGQDDPSNWKLGIFYYNKQDKRLFPPKRFKWMGWTVNFANPYSILALFGLIILICLIMDFFR